MGGVFVGHMGRGNSGEELDIAKYCRTTLLAPSHMLMEGIEPIFWRNENISLRGTLRL